jgi:Amt family ammonium transporter
MGLKLRWWVLLRASWPGLLGLALVLALAPLSAERAWAQATDEATEETDEAATDEAAEPATEEEATETAAVTLPPYFAPTTDGEAPLWPDAGGGNAGYWITPSDGPVGDGDPAGKTATDLYNRIAHNMFSINMVWVMVSGALVMFMQFGFMAVETGLCRAKNSSHTAAMNFMIYPLGCLAFWAYGFAIGWGGWWNAPVPSGWYSSLGPGTAVLNSNYSITTGEGEDAKSFSLFGTKGFFLNELDDVSVMGLFFFMMVFMDTTATIPTGTMAERWAWKNFCLFGLWVALPYCLYAHWVWGGGWLAQSGLNWGLGHGAVDFAGSGVVHTMGGFLALAGGIVIGPRIGKYVNGKPQAMPGHNIPMVVMGTFVLAFGWFGFNAGSTLSGTDLRLATVVVNTMLASVAAAFSTMLYMMFVRGGKPDTTMLCNGMLAGLVAITAPCAFVGSTAAVVIGLIAGVLVVESVFFWDRIGVDDCVGAISVHGINGFWGVVSLGIFANGKYGMGWNGVVREAYDPNMLEDGLIADGVRGAMYGDWSQLWAQLLSACVCASFAFIMGYVWFKFSNLITPLRVPAEVERQGLDIPEMGVPGYPDFMQAPHA